MNSTKKIVLILAVVFVCVISLVVYNAFNPHSLEGGFVTRVQFQNGGVFDVVERG